MGVFAFVSGSWIFLGFVVVALLAVVFGYFTYTGSGIDSHPAKSGDDSPGASEPSSAGGKGRTSDDAGTFDSRGTR
jgi:flagellar basal body-associated protein FliL